jgi:hypothetical protein
MKVLGTKYGVEITRPWNPAMYEHNDKVAQIMKENIFKSLNIAYVDDDEAVLRDIAKAILAYGFGDDYDFDSMYEEACIGLDQIQNYWLNEEYPWLVKMGYCPAVEEGFVGY